MNFVFAIIAPRILHGLLANLNADHLYLRHFLANRDANSAYTAAQVENHIALFHCVDDVGVEYFAHVQVDLQKSSGRNTENVVEDAFLVVRGTP